MKCKVTIILRGCDDETQWHRKVTVKQLNLLKELSDESHQHSESDCQPVLVLSNIKAQS